MRKIVLFFVAMTMIAGAHAQTRRIAHRSHSTSKSYRHNESKDNYGIPMPAKMNSYYLSIPKPVSTVTWVADTVNGMLVWRLDTMRTTSVNPSKVSYQNLIINDVSELGHVCTKATPR